MLSPTVALIWEIWLRKRRLAVFLAGILLLSCLINVIFADSFHAKGNEGNVLKALNNVLQMISVLIALAISSYTDFNPQQEVVGFPHRMFVLPVRSLLLVLVPMVLGIVLLDGVIIAWNAIVLIHDEGLELAWAAWLMSSYMVFHQTLLWTLARLRALRVLVVALVALLTFTLEMLPSFPLDPSSLWSSKGFTGGMATGAALISFLIAWGFVARQRSGGGRHANLFETTIERMADALPRRRRDFASPGAAQFWFEWRRNGVVLPLCIGGLLLFVIAPLSFYLRDDPASTLHTFAALITMPIILAVPVGKAFSKPDFWTAELSLPAFTAVRPLATAELVVVKMKVAAASALVSWLLVVAFISVWLSLWGNTAAFRGIGLLLGQIYENSAFRGYAALGFAVLAGLLLTWRFLVAGLWIGLSGKKALFAASAIPYAFTPIVLGILAILLVDGRDPLIDWARSNLGRLQALVWIAAVALLAKFFVSWVAWRKVSRGFRQTYGVVWVISTASMMVFVMLLPDPYRLRNLLMLVALLVVPLGRPGLASALLARNRHR